MGAWNNHTEHRSLINITSTVRGRRKWSSYENGASVLLPRNIQGYYANGMIMTIIMEWHYNGITNF